MPSDQPYDVVVTTTVDSASVGAVAGAVVVTLPARSWADPVRVSVGGETVAVLIDQAEGMDEAVRLIRRYVSRSGRGSGAAPAPVCDTAGKRQLS